MVTGLRAKSFENMQLNAGIFLKNFDYSTATDAKTLFELIQTAKNTEGSIIGATIGGGTFTCTPNMRQIEVDGKRFEFVGSQVNDGWNIYLSGTMKEIRPDSIRDALISADTKTEGNVTTITLRNDIADTDYIKSLVWCGNVGRDKLVLIDISNALNTAGAALTFTDKGEGSIPFEFHAHAADLADEENAPVTIKFFDKAK